MTDWQPIETAPKDGRYILCGWRGEKVIFVCYFSKLVDNFLTIPFSFEPEIPYTHWQPLPEPPKG